MPDPGAWGVDPGYEDVNGRWVETPRASVEAVLEAMGAEGEAPAPAPVRVVTAGRVHRLNGRWELVCEDGATAVVEGSLPDDLPTGYHQLIGDEGRVRLIVAPERCHLPDGLRTWGWVVQLYALRSRSSWGMGDLGDLRELSRAAAAHGAGMVLVNPLHAPLPGLPQQASPYYPSSRCFRNPLYLRVEGAPPPDLDRANDRIDRDAVHQAKLPALAEEYVAFQGDRGFDEYCIEMGEVLERYATFCVLSERHGRPWWQWPVDARSPARAAADPERVRFHQWLQWRIDDQLAAAGEATGLVHDLAIGVDPAGADAWLWQETFSPDVRVGAPPDAFNADGQEWGLPPFDPWRLRRLAYEPFVQTIRAGLRHAAGLRIDHVMGLFRLFWIPPGVEPPHGVYVRYPWRDLLGIVALESERAGAYLVGEDLGTVEPWVREELARRRVLSYRLLWFEDDDPVHWPAQALAAVTTHDLPTIAGVWRGADRPELRERLRGGGGDALADVVAATYEALAEVPAMLVAATLEDVLEVEERPNRPGTTDEWNWSRPLPLPLEQLVEDERVARVAALLDRR